MKKILIIEDDVDVSMLLKRFLTKHNYEVLTAHSGNKGLSMFDEEQPNLVLCDFRLGDLDGMEVLSRIKDKNYNVPVIIITGYSDIKIAVKVIKLGAFDYITKPLFPDEILLTIKRAFDSHESSPSQPGDNNSEMQPDDGTYKKPRIIIPSANTEFLIGNSSQSKALYKQIDLVAPTNYSVIIYGESGSGKEAIAQSIHARSLRKDMPFVAMDCGAISKELAGSELFGHEKGSFTGAMGTKIGHFELANGGTLFLDEVGNLPYETQALLLRVIQERKMKRIGGTKEILLDVRLIVASNENLNEAYRRGKFREDLFHRFNEFSISVPPLRERKDDIMHFARFFLEKSNAELNKNIKDFEPDVIQYFLDYPWYGNLREMKNVIKRAALLSETETIEAKSLPLEISNHSKLIFPENKTSDEMVSKDHTPNLKAAAHEAEYEMILKVLKQVNFNKSKAAKLLNIDRKTLYNKMRAFDL
jgi:two-component system, NtrC family, response regulator HydG